MEGTSQLNNGNKTLNTLNMVGNAARNNTASAPQQQNEQENSARLHQPQHPFNKEFHRQPQFKQGFQGKFQGHQPPQAHQPPHHHHPYAREAGAWRGSRKNWRNNSDPITQTMEIGEWSMGAESFEAGCRG
ncbi:hypothetical protein MJO28_008673 [Puccinia striiformis f. sp. tritici]|uniref:Uncharacterized protein n=2 Tax=Puccinia striiformis TaxID=27350 RepID=A0A2S4US92_9BASI|nr:hypothetical protein MJO28_008673 [Puccinia striiformis f. sp. tritici]POW00184.1 hypothetical protein PSTT_13291 [Puccinia striiformis]